MRGDCEFGKVAAAGMHASPMFLAVMCVEACNQCTLSNHAWFTMYCLPDLEATNLSLAGGVSPDTNAAAAAPQPPKPQQKHQRIKQQQGGASGPRCAPTHFLALRVAHAPHVRAAIDQVRNIQTKRWPWLAPVQTHACLKHASCLAGRQVCCHVTGLVPECM